MSDTLQRPRRFEPKARLLHKEMTIPKGKTLESIIDARADASYRRNEAERYRSYLRAFEPAQLEAMLGQIDPDGKMPYGARFVRRMLASTQGKRELEHFINRALAIMDVENGLDIQQDFTPEQRDMLLSDDANWKPVEQRIEQMRSLAKTPGKIHGGLTRRMMMGAGIVGAAGLAGEGVIGGASHVAGLNQPHLDKEKDGWRRELQKTQEKVAVLESVVLATIGVHYAHDVHVEHERMKDEEKKRRVKEVEDVVYDLAQMTRAKRPRSVAEIYRGVSR